MSGDGSSTSSLASFGRTVGLAVGGALCLSTSVCIARKIEDAVDYDDSLVSRGWRYSARKPQGACVAIGLGSILAYQVSKVAAANKGTIAAGLTLLAAVQGPSAYHEWSVEREFKKEQIREEGGPAVSIVESLCPCCLVPCFWHGVKRRARRRARGNGPRPKIRDRQRFEQEERERMLREARGKKNLRMAQGSEDQQAREANLREHEMQHSRRATSDPRGGSRGGGAGSSWGEADRIATVGTRAGAGGSHGGGSGSSW